MAVFDPQTPQIYVDGDYLPLDGVEPLDIVDPASLNVVGRSAHCPADYLATVIESANAAQMKWRQTDTKTRAACLHRVADAIEKSSFHDVALLMVREMGKPYPEAVGELANVAPVFRYFAEMARDQAGKIAGTTQPGSFQYTRDEPYGVSVHIVPFNFPILLMCWTVAASLAAGNACIVKPSEATSLCTLRFMAHFNELAPGLVNCVVGGASTAQALIENAGTHIVAFTGGVDAGRKVNMACARLMKPAVIEAGGNDAMIISESAPLDVAVPGAVTAAFHLSGQVCTSTERLFVHDTIHDTFVARFVAATRALRIGPGLSKAEVGPLVSRAAREKVIDLVEGAIAEGATLACGGGVPSQHNTGWYFEPTVLIDARPDMTIMQNEMFGPVVAVCRISSFEEALRLANQSRYGLGASIFTSDMAEAQRASEMLEAGMVWINNPLIDNDALPFGGWKLSGIGRELGRHGLDAFRQTKMVVTDAVPTVQEWWYPYPDDWFYDGAGRKFD